jgi:hypothetical protein
MPKRARARRRFHKRAMRESREADLEREAAALAGPVRVRAATAEERARYGLPGPQSTDLGGATEERSPGPDNVA